MLSSGDSSVYQPVVSFKLVPTDPCRNGKKSTLFAHKIGYNSACVGDKCQILVQT